MNIRVLGNRVMVRRDNPMQKTEGGLFVPSVAQGKTTRGEVLGVGSKVNDVEKGHRVMFSSSAGVELKHSGEDLLILREEDIIAIVVE